MCVTCIIHPIMSKLCFISEQNQQVLFWVRIGHVQNCDLMSCSTSVNVEFDDTDTSFHKLMLARHARNARL
jgi:hypothetical protein